MICLEKVERKNRMLGDRMENEGRFLKLLNVTQTSSFSFYSERVNDTERV